MNWYDTVLDLDRTAERHSYQPGIVHETGLDIEFRTTVLPPEQVNDLPVQDKKEPKRVLVHSQFDITDPCYDTCLEQLREAAEKTDHHYFIFTKHPLSFVQKPLFHRHNIWIGVSLSANSGLPFGAMELLQAFPKNNWVWYIDMRFWSEEQSFMIRPEIKWLILDCSEHHRIMHKSAPLPYLDSLIKQAEQENIPVFMSKRLTEIVPASMCRKTIPEKIEVRTKCI